MPHFLLVYDQRDQRILELKEFGEDDRDIAMRAREEREEAELGNQHIEVVLFGAASEAALRRTHARYFQTVSEIASRGL